MDLLVAKIGALCVMFILAVTACLIPIKLRKIIMTSSFIPERYTVICLSASLCFGAGVLMATVFLHILKETRESFAAAVDKEIISDTEFALPELMVCAGFFLIYFLEELVHLWVHYDDDDCDDIEERHEHHQFRRMSSVRVRLSLRNRPRRQSNGSAVHVECQEGRGHPSHNDMHEFAKQEEEVYIHNNNDTKKLSINKDSVNVKLEKSSTTHAQEESLVRSMIVIVALSLHGAFEGLSLGLENDIHNVWLLCVALSSHKVFIAFSIGMELLEEGVNIFLFLFQMAVFSLASPIGGIIGVTLTLSISSTSAGLMTIAVLQAISGGTILYVTFCEVLERERMKASGRLIKLFSLIAGFAVIASLEAAVSHNHAEENTELIKASNETIGLLNHDVI